MPNPGAVSRTGKIWAIKELRSETKCSLLEAKTALEERKVQELLDRYYGSFPVDQKEADDRATRRAKAEILMNEIREFYRWYHTAPQGKDPLSTIETRLTVFMKILESTGVVEKINGR